MRDLIETVSHQILEALEQDKLLLPTLPEVALRVREVAEDPNADLNKLAAEIGKDPALAARIIRVANSPILRASREIQDLKMALSRLGMEYTCNLATGLAMEQMFQATTDIIDRRLREVWTRSSEIAGICHVLCKHSAKSLKPDKATLAGLTHRIGELPILTFAEEHPALLKDSLSLDKVIENLHTSLGSKILAKWDFPDLIQQVPMSYLNFDSQKPEADYADLVTVAMLQSYAGSDHYYAELDYSTVTAFERLGIDTNADEVENMDEEMAAAMAMLSG